MWIPVVIALTTGPLFGQEIMGDWQGTLTVPKEEIVFGSNEAEVLKEIQNLIGGLKQ
jgi:hypothetical protein